MQFWNKNRSIKSKILRSIFPFLKLRQKNLKWYYKLYVYFDILFMLAFIFFLFSYIFVFLSFQRYDIDHLKIYTNIHLKEDSVRSLKNEISVFESKNKISPQSINVFLMDSNILFYSLMPPGTQLFLHDSDGATLFSNMIIIHTLKSDRYLIKVLKHELIHTWQMSHYSLYTLFSLKHWVKEGYPTYRVGLKSAFIDKKEKRDFIDWYVYKIGIKNFDQQTKETYIFSALMVKHAIEKMHCSVDELHEGKVEYDEVLNSLLEEYNITKESK